MKKPKKELVDIALKIKNPCAHGNCYAGDGVKETDKNYCNICPYIRSTGVEEGKIRIKGNIIDWLIKNYNTIYSSQIELDFGEEE